MRYGSGPSPPPSNGRNVSLDILAQAARGRFRISVPPRHIAGIRRLLRSLPLGQPDPDHPPDLYIVGFLRDNPHPAFRSDLARLAHLAIPPLQRDAREALDMLGQISAAKLIAAIKAHTSFQTLSNWLLLESNPRSLMPELIRFLESKLPDTPAVPHSAAFLIAQTHPAVAAMEMLDVIAVRLFGPDVTAWRTFYDTHQNIPYEAWLLEAARNGNVSHRVKALWTLGHRATPTSAAQDAVRTHLSSDTSEGVRAAAAEALLS